MAVADAALLPGEVVADDEHDLVVWRTADGRACVMDSRCPHQWSHLAAEGVVDGDELVCAAHFWRFDTEGHGSKLNVGGRRDAKADIDVMACRETDGRIWALLRRAPLAAVLMIVLLAVMPTGHASPAGAQDFGTRRITSFDVEVVAQEGGSALVTERIVYDFGSTPRHGIERYIPVRFPYEGEKPDEELNYERVTPIEDLQVVSPSAPDQFETETSGGNLLIRVGDPDRTITGQHTYELSYLIRGVFNSYEDHDELNFNVTGNGWSVPIDAASAAVRGPAVPTMTACYAGPQGSQLECDSHSIDGDVARFAQEGLGVGEGLTIVVAYPPGTIDATPILDEKWSVGRAFDRTPWTLGGGLVLLVGGAALIGWMLWRYGRDRRSLASPVDAAFGGRGEAAAGSGLGGPAAGEAPVPLFDRPIDPVEFVPPDGIRPGHMGTLWDEVAHPLDVSAMIIDLAVRGYLRIEEVEAPSAGGAFGFGQNEGDYRFVRLEPAQQPALPAGELSSAERLLLDGLFRDGDAPVLSELRTQFSSRLALVQGALYDDAVAAGWFPTRPDRVRARWNALGLTVLVLGVALVVLAAIFTHVALLVLPIPLIGLAIVAFSKRFPHRTSRGTALLGRVRGFRELFAVGEGERQRFLESKHLFSQYLPYAIVFGMADQWAATFQALGVSPQELGVGVWYSSPYGYDPLTFAWAMSSFSTVTTGSIAAAAPSSTGAASGFSGFGGGGFSGGGFGGGGGGDW